MGQVGHLSTQIQLTLPKYSCTKFNDQSSKFVSLWGIFRPTREIFTHVTGEGRQMLTYTRARHSWPLSSEGSLACHTYCDTGHPFIMVISEDPWHSHLFSSPELKAQVSFSDCLLSVVCLCVCPSVNFSFTFSTFSPKPPSQFQPNLSQSILGWWGFQFVQMKLHTLFKGEKITKL